jgi:hypothetical protein
MLPWINSTVAHTMKILDVNLEKRNKHFHDSITKM